LHPAMAAARDGDLGTFRCPSLPPVPPPLSLLLSLCLPATKTTSLSVYICPQLTPHL
jgi:hypothetical protein